MVSCIDQEQKCNPPRKCWYASLLSHKLSFNSHHQETIRPPSTHRNYTEFCCIYLKNEDPEILFALQCRLQVLTVSCMCAPNRELSCHEGNTYFLLDCGKGTYLDTKILLKMRCLHKARYQNLHTSSIPRLSPR